MNSRRQERIAHLLQEAMSEVFRRELGSIVHPKTLVTITKVKVSPDLSAARFFLSIFNTDMPDECLLAIEQHTPELRYQLGNRLRHELRRIPELLFERDDTLDYVERMDEVFKEIKDEGGKEEEE